MSRIVRRIRRWWARRQCAKHGHVKAPAPAAHLTGLAWLLVAGHCPRCGAYLAGAQTFTIEFPYGINPPADSLP